MSMFGAYVSALNRPNSDVSGRLIALRRHIPTLGLFLTARGRRSIPSSQTVACGLSSRFDLRPVLDNTWGSGRASQRTLHFGSAV